MKKLKSLISYVLITCLAGILGVFLVAPASHANTPLVCNMSTVTGDDDGSFPMTLPFSLQLGNTNYNQIYYSTNGLMSFGRPDGNFSSYPSTPSVTLAGRDWVSFGPGAYTSYGYNQDSFCIEWSVRPFPQSSGPLTQIRLVVNVFPNGGWHGEITTLGWIPPDIRRGIVWEENGTPLPIGAAFDVNGGVPIEVPPAPAPTSFTQPPVIPTQCWNGSTVYAPATCPPIPPDIVCWDNSTVPWNGTCPTQPPPITCWDGSVIPYDQTCLPTPPDIVCWDNSTIPWNSTCLPEPPPIECWDGTSVPWNQSCSPEPQVLCWDNSIVHFESECDPTPPDITCWNGEVISWNEICPQIPPMVECWDGSEVNWNEQCPVQPITYPVDAISLTVNENQVLEYTPPMGMKISDILFASYGTPDNYQYGLCHAVGSQFIVENYLIGNTSLIIGANNDVFGDPCGGTGKRLSVVITIEIDPTYVAPSPTPTASPEPQPSESQTPTLEPSPQPTEPSPQPSETFVQPSETPSPSPTPSLSPSESPLQPQEPAVTPSPTPEPETSSPEPLVPDSTESPTPDPSPETTDLPSNNNIIDGLTLEESIALNELLTEYGPMDAVSFEDFEASGLDYEDLPPNQPIMLENGVILTAEVADAIEIFSDPSELLLTVLTDPGKALKAFANVGADMTPEQRKESQIVVVASIIVGQVISTTNLITGRIR